MSCATTCLKCLVILCNLLLATIGLILLGGGIFLMVGYQKYISQYNTEFIVRSVEEWSGNSTNSVDDGKPSLDFSAYVTPLSIALIVFGAFIALVGLGGIFGVCCSSRVLLVTYAIVTILLMTAEIIITVLFFTHAFDDRIRSQVLYTLKENYVGLMDRGQDSLAWNYIMINLECCGLNSYNDFNSTKKWRGNEIASNIDLPLNSSAQVTPLACCKTVPNLRSDSDFTCSTNPTNQTSNWKTGCWDKVLAVLQPYRTVTIGIISAIVVAQALLALMAILIARRLPNDNWKDI